MPLAMFPVAFGILQLVEGVIWLKLLAPSPQNMALYVYLFLFFSHFFWPFWTPFSMYSLEEGRRKRLLLALTVIGGAFGLSLYVPIVLNEWVDVGVVDGHIQYDTRLIYDGVVPNSVIRLIYAAIVLVALFSVRRTSIRIFGGLILLTIIAAYFFYLDTFISVWCFFAAMVSTYVIALVRRQCRSDRISP